MEKHLGFFRICEGLESIAAEVIWLGQASSNELELKIIRSHQLVETQRKIYEVLEI